MTFTTSLKEEISKSELDLLEARAELEAFLRCSAKVTDNIEITLENASVARRMYKAFKMIFEVNPNVTVRIQKRFRVKQIYIITIKDKVDYIKRTFDLDNNSVKLNNDDERISFLKGAFLAIGNISNPQTSGYHLEFICNNEKIAKTIQNGLNFYKLNAKTIKRGYKLIVYIKASENISDLIKMFKATSALFFFEDIRIYRDHKNMVNRLNNCEISNQTRIIETGQKQLNNINYLKKHDLVDLFDDKTKIVIEAREKYPEMSLAELADVITIEYNYPIGKSGVNHHFIKIAKIVQRHMENN